MNHSPILLVEDDRNLREALQHTLEMAGFSVEAVADGAAAQALLQRQTFSAVLTDYQMKPVDGLELLRRIRAAGSHLPVLMITAHGSIDHAVNCMLEGATDYLAKPFEPAALVNRLRTIIPDDSGDAGIIAVDPAMQNLLDLARRVADGETTVLLAGESGTGKEVLARYIHRHSPRAKNSFVAINCAAIPENMLEALLFGHEKGAFTGAHESRPGKFEQAQHGTLLLDEISEMDIGLQAKLLRVLQEREVERIGGRAPVPLDVRVIATTNRDLREAVARGRFREDLYYRLSVFPIRIPALRERTADIVPLARHFLGRHHDGHGPAPVLDEAAAAGLLRHAWPGNVRELENLIQRALILAAGRRIGTAQLQFDSCGHQEPEYRPPGADGTTEDEVLEEQLRSVEGQLIADALRRSESRKHAAELLGISPRTLRYKIARLRESGVQLPGRQTLAGSSLSL